MSTTETDENNYFFARVTSGSSQWQQFERKRRIGVGRISVVSERLLVRPRNVDLMSMLFPDPELKLGERVAGSMDDERGQRVGGGGENWGKPMHSLSHARIE